ncbi:MAG: hypothetical protein GSR86_03835 [Desulfurococcales archaeon]|nr:hypothetical protein [Desulfurococcales archaeon]
MPEEVDKEAVERLWRAFILMVSSGKPPMVTVDSERLAKILEEALRRRQQS